MAIKFYNTMTRKKEDFKTQKEGIATMYNCGLTVYDYAHVGNLRAYTFADLIRRYLEYRGYTVKQVMNFTDVGHMTEDEVISSDLGEDKMEKAAKRENKTVWDIADYYTKEFLADSKKIGLKEPDVRPKPSEHIKEIIEMIKILIDKGYAYNANGSVYYDVSKFKDYGKLSGNTIDKLKAGSGGRVEFNKDKKNQFDFALWINSPKHIMTWESPWSVGYPGWHIECSVMATKYLGDTIDIHTGAEDNIFPHHECEIAQTEGATGKRFVNYWMHLRHLLVNGTKMSKSLGNFYTLKDIEKKGYSPLTLRYMLISVPYRTALNLTDKSLEQAKNTVENLNNFMINLKDYKTDIKDNTELKDTLEIFKNTFEDAMDDDLDTAKAFAELFNFVTYVKKAMHTKSISEKDAHLVFELFKKIDTIFGIITLQAEDILEDNIKILVDARELARAEKDFEKADKIRNQLTAVGIILEDSDSGVKWRKK
ncbi:MAG: cysteine--tRNA ligase [DPANN group archaeon]|nr:cysteine--tRNA ligase [DPANN group archaeon]